MRGGSYKPGCNCKVCIPMQGKESREKGGEEDVRGKYDLERER